MRGNITEVITHLKGFVPEIARQEHIRIAREGLAKIKAKNIDIPYRITVDGKEAFSELEVKPFGVIKYTFIRLPQIARFALHEAQNLSPVLSGKYRKSWMFLVDGKPFFSALDLPNNAKRITLVNFQPYSRKLNLRKEYSTGQVSIPPGVVEKVKEKTKKKFSLQANFTTEYIELKGGYRLKNNYVQTRARHGRDRLHTEAGRRITYPALIIIPRN